MLQIQKALHIMCLACVIQKIEKFCLAAAVVVCQISTGVCVCAFVQTIMEACMFTYESSSGRLDSFCIFTGLA